MVVTPTGETLISVDVETAGPSPRRYAMLSIGACLVDDPDTSFYAELRPDSPETDPAALAVSGLALDELARTGLPPQLAMARFANWVDEVTPAASVPVFTAFNAPFDWMFVNDYLLRYVGRNPFGHSALDIKAYAMGVRDVPWRETSMHVLSEHYLGGRMLSHNALSDARDQAALFRAIRREHGDEHGHAHGEEAEHE